MLDTSRLKLYKASAGSGKTYTLTQQYLLLALSGLGEEGIDSTLAITFTNAATADMKLKILSTLKEIAGCSYGDMEFLSEHLHLPVDRIQQRGKAAFRYILHHYSRFSIQTIDSFVQNHIRAFAFELGLPVDFEPSLELQKLSEDLVRSLLNRCGKKGSEEVTNMVLDFIRSESEENRTLNVGDKMRHVVELLFEEHSIPYLADLKSNDYPAFFENTRKFEQEFKQAVVRLIERGRALINENRLLPEYFHEGSRGVYGLFTSNKDMDKIFPPSSSVQKSVDKGILKEDYETYAVEFRQIYEELMGLDSKKYFLCRQLKKNIYSLALLSYFKEELEDVKMLRHIVPISEFNVKINEALRTESVPFIYEKTGEKYKHIFIDEFQDTSILQWENLWPLIENNLSEACLNLVVGDPKQSIYRFRQADIEQFVRLSQSDRVDLQLLKSNWRSHPGIVAFNNHFYDFITANVQSMSGLGEDRKVYIRAIYGDQKQYCKKEPQYPEADYSRVRIGFAPRQEEDKSDWYFRQIYHIVKNKRHALQDIAILCRTNEQSRKVADFLVAHGIKVISPDSLTLYSNTLIKGLVTSLKYIYYQDSVSRIGVLKFSKATSTDLAISDAVSFKWTELENIRTQYPSIYEQVEALLRFWKLDQAGDQYLLSFLDVLWNRNFNTIEEVLEWYNEQASKTSIAAGEQPDAVRVMSIHKSKGLEFKVVIYPFANEKISVHKGVHWVQGEVLREMGLKNAVLQYSSVVENTVFRDDMQEEKFKTFLDILNLAYVATTRPKDYLYILCDQTDGAKDWTLDKFATNQLFAKFVQEYPEYVMKEEEYRMECSATSLSDTPTTPTTQSSPLKLMPSIDWRRNMEAAFTFNRETRDQVEWGNRVHHLLSLIETYEEGNLSELVETVLRKSLATDWEMQSREEVLRKILLRVLRHPILQPLFTQAELVRNEADLYSERGHLRPDRLTYLQGAWVIVDYKTGEKNDAHLLQLKEYTALLRDYGERVSAAYLVYLDTDKVEVVKTDMDE